MLFIGIFSLSGDLYPILADQGMHHCLRIIEFVDPEIEQSFVDSWTVVDPGTLAGCKLSRDFGYRRSLHRGIYVLWLRYSLLLGTGNTMSIPICEYRIRKKRHLFSIRPFARTTCIRWDARCGWRTRDSQCQYSTQFASSLFSFVEFWLIERTKVEYTTRLDRRLQKICPQIRENINLIWKYIDVR